MAEGFFVTCFTGEEVLELMHRDGEDGRLDDIFPGSDEEFRFTQEESEGKETLFTT